VNRLCAALQRFHGGAYPGMQKFQSLNAIRLYFVRGNARTLSDLAQPFPFALFSHALPGGISAFCENGLRSVKAIWRVRITWTLFANFCKSVFKLPAKHPLNMGANLIVKHRHLRNLQSKAFATGCKVPCQNASLFRASSSQRKAHPASALYRALEGPTKVEDSVPRRIDVRGKPHFCVTPLCHTCVGLALRP
jgi:hypothetical protein